MLPSHFAVMWEHWYNWDQIILEELANHTHIQYIWNISKQFNNSTLLAII